MNHHTDMSDYSHQVFHFFDLYRTPFAVVCAASLFGFFQVLSRHRRDRKQGFEKFLTRQVHIAFMAAVVLSLAVILISTVTTSTILRGAFDPKAESAYECIMREFKFQYTAIQWCCIVSIISLVRGSYIHFILDHGLFHSKNKEEFFMVVTDAISFITGTLAYVNSTLHSWDSFYDMTFELIKMIWHGWVDEHKPLRTISLFSAGVTLGLFLKITIFNEDSAFNKFIRHSFGAMSDEKGKHHELDEKHHASVSAETTGGGKKHQ